ncbi:hypothetical protein K504DRAFT_460399 [Pleomassaria siparia CBS 279.74]|uniref:R3H-associated N-terminal domain-containing protein n=1 Tax=Pleomassaria siparia CBS 279.74 TaxID=1314801 RepID=A0A6G1JZQ1_9PLEO|nr:hypothetical protein K504DRAFT_460399 [Pleomassaria siparia CBS 279.74]
MAIHPTNEAPPSSNDGTPAQPINIEAWTEQATAALSSVTISAPGELADATVSLSIPLDDVPVVSARKVKEGAYYVRKEPLRRDSMKSRERMAKGNEGSRRRQRWENDRLLSNPHAEPPQPKDWEIRPTYPVRHVPYYLAPLWDAGLRQNAAERKTAAAKAKTKAVPKIVAAKPTIPGVVPKELRDKLKRSRGAKGLLIDLESEVRKFVENWEEKERRAEAINVPADPDSSDDEIVFVGRNGQMNDLPSPTREEIKREMKLFETLAGDQSGSFGRWLVHHIGTYYGLDTWSVTVGEMREAYVGLKEVERREGARRKSVYSPIPRPLWGMV